MDYKEISLNKRVRFNSTHFNVLNVITKGSNTMGDMAIQEPSQIQTSQLADFIWGM
jgi:hypothetical protein